MSEELRRKLQELEEEYKDMPPAVRQADLPEINKIRAQLNMPPVDAQLNELGVDAVEEKKKEPELKPEPVPDFTEAREIYQAYLNKKSVLEPHRKYAEKVAVATEGAGMTPVRPLATMGTNGGPLLCDHCKKPIVLEGGNFHGKTADVAWEANPNEKWHSWILGGMVVEIQTNGTLRIYHGYMGNSNQCCNIANREDKEARSEYEAKKRSTDWLKMLAFLKSEFPDMSEDEQSELLNDVLNTVLDYDPGIGINRPDGETKGS